MKFQYSFFTALTLLLVMITTSCKEEESNETPIENPFSDYLTETGFTEVEEYVDAGFYEFGISFKPLVNGKIETVIVRLPDNATDLRVTFWEVSDKSVLSTETITTIESGVELTQSITPVELIADTEYMITFNSNDWYNYRAPDDSDATYPITVGNISVTGYAYIGGTGQVFPTNFQTDYYAGDLSFSFVAD